MSRARDQMRSLALVALVAAGCDDTPTRAKYRVTMLATAESEPVAGVRVQVEQNEFITDASGITGWVLADVVGTHVTYRVVCPSGYKTNQPEGTIVLRPTASPEEETPLQFNVACTPNIRSATIVVRASARSPSERIALANLPVVIDGRTIGYTSSAGVLHATFRGDPNQNIRVAVDASSLERVSPPRLEQTFILPTEDTILSFAAEFDVGSAVAPSTPVPVETARPPRRRRRSTGGSIESPTVTEPVYEVPTQIRPGGEL